MGKRIKEMEEILQANPDDYVAVDGDHSEARKITVLHLLGSTNSGVSSFNDRTGAVFPEAGDYTPDMVGIIGAISNITIENLPPNVVAITDFDGKIITSAITAAELQSLSGIQNNVQTQINDVPKYNFLESTDGINIAVSDEMTEQSNIDEVAISVISSMYTSPLRWDAVRVRFNFEPSFRYKEAFYYYNNDQWNFLCYTSTGVTLANGNDAGIVRDSNDITYMNGTATVHHSISADTSEHSDVSDGIVGMDNAGANKYYGTDANGDIGFYDQLNVVQEIGYSETVIMSQKAVTEAIQESINGGIEAVEF